MIGENIKMALSSLYSNKMRSFLTMLGIIIGIGAVIMVSALGDSVRRMFADLFSSIGLGQMYVSMAMEESRDSDFFTPDDVEKLYEAFPNKLAYVDYSDAATLEMKTTLKRKKVLFNGVDYKYAELQPTISMVHGKFISQADVQNSSNVAVLRQEDAKKFFGNENAVGRTFRAILNGENKEFTVVGIYKENVSPLQKALMGQTGETGTIYIPLSLFKASHNGVSMIRLFANPKMTETQIQTFVNEIKTYILRLKNRTENDYYFQSAQDQFRQLDGLLSTLSLVLGSIAGISLVVGGIGIMNIMLVSVTERTKEIGIRKALGATTGDILQQFLIESAALSGVGGLIGTLLAISIVTIVGIVTKTSVVIKPESVIVAVSFSALVGLFFGLYPARKAASKDPIEALRFE
jgi:hypothetical protein